ncbi:MAG TPA: S-adenosylmethionine:tRNA ribosyltransferase-isomerase [Caulobacteraceae bacterium]|jgi:S-adenosylmethionine:tRNA ribosyltransferase-isomerase|nr:S-adenosylmethionine:tRNA ribosyltransferase-isomerase [Caulobacteraceae bacterium]
MKPAGEPVQRPADARLLVVGADRALRHLRRGAFASQLRRGDLVIANDAATIPASLRGVHLRTGAAIEVRLAARASLAFEDVTFSAVLFGEGDHRTPTERRAPPPTVRAGDRLALGPLVATVEVVLGHPRFVRLTFVGDPGAVWAGIAAHGRAVQYAYMPARLALWDTWTPIAGPPAAFEPPSAGFALDWAMLREIRWQGARFATLTHAAGLSSTGDAALDTRLPLPEAYRIPSSTVRAIERARSCGGRIIAVGTTVTRALEHSAALQGRVVAGDGLADQRLGPASALRVADAILSGAHEPGSSHYDLLGAFADAYVLAAADAELQARGYRTHEFGDSVLVWRRRQARVLAAA